MGKVTSLLSNSSLGRQRLRHCPYSLPYLHEAQGQEWLKRAKAQGSQREKSITQFPPVMSRAKVKSTNFSSKESKSLLRLSFPTGRLQSSLTSPC
jgi:hypothetical protein